MEAAVNLTRDCFKTTQTATWQNVYVANDENAAS